MRENELAGLSQQLKRVQENIIDDNKITHYLCIYSKQQKNISLFPLAFPFTKFYLYQRMHLFLSYTKIT